MPERTEPVQPVRVTYECDEDACDGEMSATSMLPTSPPKYNLECDECGATTTSRKNYPQIEYRRIWLSVSASGLGWELSEASKDAHFGIYQ